MSNTLALLGGTPVTNKEWPFYNTIGDEEKAEVMNVLDSGVLSDFIAAPGDRFLGGRMVRQLEQEWSQRFGTKHAVSMNSATSCLHAALAAIGVGPGDEVLVPQIGMSASAAVIPALGATPVFTDCNSVTLNIDVEHAATLVTPRTKAIMVVHVAGQPADMNEVLELARKHDIKVVEDNAQAPGALYNGQEIGTMGDIGCYSLNCHKVIQCGEGGVAVTNDDDLALRLQLFRNHAEKGQSGFGVSHWGMYGLNLRLSELSAAVAIHQLRKLDVLNAKTVEYCTMLTEGIDLPGINPPVPGRDRTHVYYIYHWDYRQDVVGVSPEIFAKAIQAEGFPVNAHYSYLISDLPPFNGGRAPQPQPQNDSQWPGASKAIANSLWTMFIRPHLEEKDVMLFIETMNKVYDQRERLAEELG